MAWILEAAGEVFAELGHAGATTNKIAARAGVSIGSLYQYFPNKDALVAALLEAHRVEVGQVLARGLKRLADPAVPLDDALRAVLDDLVDLHAANPALQRVLGEVARRLPSKHEDHREQERAIERVLRARPEVTVEDPALAAILVARTTEALARYLGHDAPPDLARPALVDEGVSMVVGYLTRRPGSA